MVELSVQVPEVSVSKFSVSGTPNAVMLPPFVRANVDCAMREEPTAAQIKVTAINDAIDRRRVAD